MAPCEAMSIKGSANFGFFAAKNRVKTEKKLRGCGVRAWAASDVSMYKTSRLELRYAMAHYVNRTESNAGRRASAFLRLLLAPSIHCCSSSASVLINIYNLHNIFSIDSFGYQQVGRRCREIHQTYHKTSLLSTKFDNFFFRFRSYDYDSSKAVNKVLWVWFRISLTSNRDRQFAAKFIEHFGDIFWKLSQSCQNIYRFAIGSEMGFGFFFIHSIDLWFILELFEGKSCRTASKHSKIKINKVCSA